MNIIYWVIISIVLGFIRYKVVFSRYNFEKDLLQSIENAPWQLKFEEVWNSSISFFIGGFIFYYFIEFRWIFLVKGGALELRDLFLFIVFIMAIFGHLPVLSANITKGVESILNRVLIRK
ncbi:MAG: hypothetical protein OEV93_04760 [Candidatus Moranbacteria bacterium]|nr:hypothetical protein [Candidatus Moranbacteria bacterium]